MDSGRFLLAVVLMIALVVVTNILLPPAPPPGTLPAADTMGVVTTPPPRPADAPPGDTAGQPPVAAPSPSPPAPAESAVEESGTAAAADTLTIESELHRFAFSSRGASVISAELKPFESATRAGPVELKPDDARTLFAYRLRLGERTIDLASFDFDASAVGPEEDGGPQTLRFTHEPDSVSPYGVEFVYTADPENYLVDVRARITGTGAETPTLYIDFPPTLRFNEVNPRDDEHALAYVVNHARTGIESVSLRSVKAERVVNGPLLWAALKNKYFAAALLQSDAAAMPFGGVIARPTSTPNSAQLVATLLADAQGELSFQLYLGPLEPERLAAIGHNFRDVHSFGWKPLQPILRPLGHGITWALNGMHDVLGLGYGWVLVLFGVLIRIVLWPLNAKAMRSQLKNMEIQPRLKEIQTKYKAEPERLQKEMLRLYREEGFNPMGGCLPILIPFPILITLFFVFQSTIAFRGVPFLWLPDLSRADPFYILPVLLGLSMFVLQWLTMRTTKDANPQMKFMMYFMPIFMTVLFLNFASGLNLYYAAMNLASVPQQLHVMKERQRWQASRGR